MKKQYNYELIRDYLHGLTDRETSNEIRQLIATDEVARDIAEGITLLDNRFKDKEPDLEAYLENVKQQQLEIIDKYTQYKNITRRIWFRMAAAVLILVSAGIAIRMMTGPDLLSLVDAELMEPYPESGILRDEGGKSEKEIGFQLYTQKDFANASLYFEQAQIKEKSNAAIVFYNALSYLYAGNYSKAISLFDTEVVIDSRYQQQAQWFKVLALIKSKDEKHARELLVAISKDEQHFKREAALKLLGEMK